MIRIMLFALVSANLDLVGDSALIYGHLGLPAMGITVTSFGGFVSPASTSPMLSSPP